MGLNTVIAVTCTLTAVIGAIVWNYRKSISFSVLKKKKRTNDDVDELEEDYEDLYDQGTQDAIIGELPDPRWVKVAQVEELYIYPLKSGRGQRIESCFFGDCGPILGRKNRVYLRDRMFLVYKEDTGRFQTGRNHPKLVLVSITALDESTIMLEAPGMSSITFKISNNPTKEGKTYVDCTMWYGEPVKCIDCGSDVAKWISMYLTGTENGLRLGYSAEEKRSVLESNFKRYAKVYETLRNEDAGLFSDLVSYMLMSSNSLKILNKKLKNPVTALQFRPNVVMSGSDAFAEDKWEWIKIGERVVIRNVKPCTRCGMIRVDPETGRTDEKEPMETLQTFRTLTDPKLVALEGKAPAMGIYCGLYATGRVNVGDDIFVHVPHNSMKSIS